MASDDNSLVVSLRNEHLPSYVPEGFLQLSVNASPSKERLLEPAPPSSSRDSGPPSHRSSPRNSFRSRHSRRKSDEASSSIQQPALLGSFANGTHTIWREVPATSERPAYYYNETYGVSQWHRPKVGSIHKVQLDGIDFQKRSPRYASLTPAQQANLIMGEPPKAKKKREPTAAEIEEAKAQAAQKAIEEERKFLAGEIDEAPAASGEGASGQPPDVGASSTEETAPKMPRMPLLSDTARMLGAKAEKLRGRRTSTELMALADLKQATAAAEAAKENRGEAARRAKLEYEQTLQRLVEAAAKRKEEEEKAARLAAKPPPQEPTLGKKGGTSGKDGSAGKDKVGGAGKEKDGGGSSLLAPKAADAGRPRPATYQQIEKNVKVKIAALHEDQYEREKLQRSIADQKREALELAMAADNYKPFVQLNATSGLQEQTPTRRQARMEERRQQRKHLSEEASARHAELVQEELLARVDAARRRSGDHWVNGHWATEVPSSRHLMQGMPGYALSPRGLQHSGASGMSAGTGVHGGEDGGDGTPRVSTLMSEHGAFFAQSTSKGRARRLAAKLAHIRNL